ncbi:DUF1062 domain-containing protein [Defluviimonas aestuarii]|uniref:DUF1062 domain-containing protein n=1 Tax=Albidovulum aestuarii TaxID=1130726 RepID=UPI00249CC9DB|nr:DUF1062 domain-containing protein [Defluviimonas aestuarii]MDI3338781.1 DUF1062 domain-containing protein [Defluviimonas aestuarii]
MSLHLTVHWTVLPGAAPRPWLRCAACGAQRAFAFSGKARLNANGRLLDGWLIYRCETCDATWNRPVFERRRADALPPGQLQAFQSNDPEVLQHLARDRSTLRRFTRQIDEADGVSVRRRIVASDPAATPMLTIRLDPAGTVVPRRDRILAEGLGLSRSRIASLAARGRITVMSGTVDALRRPCRVPLVIFLDLCEEPDATAIMACAKG